MGLYVVFLHKAVLTSFAALVESELAERANFATFVDSMAAEVAALDSNMQDFEKQA